MNPNRASEVSVSPCLAMTCPPPHKKALQTAKMTAVAMMCLLYSIRVDLPVNLRFPVILPQGFLIPLSLIGEGRGEVK